MSYSPDAVLKQVQDEFPMFDMTFFEEKYQGTIPVFIARVKDGEETLSDHWEKLVAHIAFNFQSQVNDQFSIWNIYLFFVTKGAIGRTLKYKIENDTFSTRKIVIEENASREELIDQHITNRDVTFSIGNSVITTPLELDSILSKFVSNTISNKRMTEDHRNSFRGIIRELKASQKDEI
ncbi:MAG TPA: ABC-three component system middle component 1 [Cyclobacteriaceae bacterium]|nr:ABC-three component system middle component 1 [Cyclobacteriaceae bacterium]